MFKNYYALTKPGIIYGNLITTATGFLLASKWNVNLALLIATLSGIALVMASGCVFNNIIDRAIDARMERTKSRGLVTGKISKQNAVIFALLLGIGGLFMLGKYTNPLSLGITLVGVFVYLVLYTIGKRRSMYGPLIGSIAGAVPPVVGYTAVTAHLELAAMILFLMLILWQMPHFYAIAIFRKEEYAMAGIPILPIQRGIRSTKILIVLYIIAFAIVSLSLTLLGSSGRIYFSVVLALNIAWLSLSLWGFRAADEKLWARKMFFFSLFTLLITFIALALDVTQ